MDHGVLHQRLQQKLGHGEVPEAVVTGDGVADPIPEAQVEESAVAVQEVQLLPKGGVLLLAQHVAENVGKFVEAVVEQLRLPDLVEGDEAVDGVDDKVGADLRLQSLELQILLGDEQFILVADLLLQLCRHMVDGGADLLEFPDGEISAAGLQIALLHLPQHGLDVVDRLLDPSVVSAE